MRLALFSVFATALLFSSATSASPVAGPAPTQSSAARMIFQFPDGVAIENVAVRSNGHLLLSIPEGHTGLMYSLDPSDPHPSPQVIANIQDATSIAGITEIAPDVFAFASGIFNRANGGFTLGSSIIWRIDFNSNHHSGPSITKIAALANVGFINGMTTLPRPKGHHNDRRDPKKNEEEDLILLADSPRGSVHLLDPATGALRVDALRDNPTMSIAPDAFAPIGINGARFDAAASTLYYSNSLRALFCRVKLDVRAPPRTGGDGLPTLTPQGGFQVVASNVLGDDFALDSGKDGEGKAKTAFLTANPANLVWDIDIKNGGTVGVLIGNQGSTEVAGCTSAAFARGKKGRPTRELYIVTSGAQLAPVNGTFTEGGKIVSINV